jgi:hypothetical protein
MLMPLNENKHQARRNYHHHYHPARFNQFQNYGSYMPNNNNNNYLTNANGYFSRMPYMHRYPNYLNVDNDFSIAQQMRQRRPSKRKAVGNAKFLFFSERIPLHKLRQSATILFDEQHE